MAKLLKTLGVLIVLGVLVGGTIWLVRPRIGAGAPSVADLSVVHPGVRALDAERRGLVRLPAGAKVETDPEGRARLRLDDGTTLIVDHATKLTVDEGKVSLDTGRLFALGAPGAKAEVKIGEATVRIGTANVGIDRLQGPARVYSANDEIVVSAGDREQKVRAGESARIEGANVTVAAEKAFDDWTGGLAAPWGAQGTPRRAVGELWGRDVGASPGDPGSPLTIRSLDVDASVNTEVATTRVTTTYFNGGSQTVSGDFRMALPPSAIVSRFAVGFGETLQEARVALAARETMAIAPSAAVLEWAGEGWVRGHLPSISSGSAVTVVVEYVEWLEIGVGATGKLNAQYRFPLAAAGDPPLIGEFSAKVDTSLTRPRSVSASSGTRIEGGVVQVRKPDYRPTADLVVDVELPPWDSGARMYVASEDGGSDFSTVLVRADLPQADPDAGATLALVVDTSGSTEASELDVARAFVRAVLDSLGPRDHVVVLAADQRVRPVGPAAIGPLDAARKTAILDAMSKLVPGGATDVGRALEAGADALPADVPTGIVVYIGDGWATVGDPDVASIEARLARRANGKPRLGAVTVGPLAHARALSALTRGSGPLLSVIDSSDATAAATVLVADALRPAFSGVELELGAEVEQVYPRKARSALAGSTIEAVGRVRNRSPSSITVKWRDKQGMHSEPRFVSLRKAPVPEDIRRRWAQARVDEVLSSGRGREAAMDVALGAKLLTPWTGWVLGGTTYTGTVLDARQLDVAIGDIETPYEESPGAGTEYAMGALVSVPYSGDVAGSGDDKELQSDVAEAAGRAIDLALPSVRACRDSRAALRPELGGSLMATLTIDGDGRAVDVKVKGTSSDADDAALNRCVEVALQGLNYPESGLTVKIRVEHEIVLPTPRPNLRGAKCSSLSTLPLPLRRGVWRAELAEKKASEVYIRAKRACELPAWADRRALLELVLSVVYGGIGRVDVARELETAGDGEAAAFLRREAVRRARDANELAMVKRALVGDEKYPGPVFKKRYKAANDDEGRLAVVRKFLTIAPHDGLLRNRLVALLEATGKKDVLGEEARRIRQDPFAPAELLADAASALRRSGNEDDARLTFGELAERAPADPWARAFLGDRLRNEGWFDDATRTYAALDQLAPEDPAATIRLALAHAGAGRLDFARRLLSRVIETGGRIGNASAGALAGHVASALLAEARGATGLGKEQIEGLAFAALEVPRSERRTVVLLRGPSAMPAITAKLVRKIEGTKEEIPVEISAPTMGLYALAFEASSADVQLELQRAEELAPAPQMKFRVDALVPSGDVATPPKLVTTEIELPATGKPVTLAWSGTGWSAKVAAAAP